MSIKYVAVSTMTESGDSEVFCIDFYDSGDVVEYVKDMMDEEFAYVSVFKVHCPSGFEIENDILMALKQASNDEHELLESL